MANLSLWARIKSGLGGLTNASAANWGFADAYKSHRAPSIGELILSYKNIAYTCAMLNAAAVAANPFKVFVQTTSRQRKVKLYETRPVSKATERYLRSKHSGLNGRLQKAVRIEEVVDHPISKLFHRPNPHHTQFELLELTMLYLEIAGNAYWRIKTDALGVPTELWPLHAQLMTIIPDTQTDNVVLAYQFSSGVGQQVFKPKEIVHHRYASLVDPYLIGVSPLRAAWEQSQVSDKLLAYEEAVLDNRARPDMLISPKEPIGQQEAIRLERKIQNKFRWGGAGGVIVGESGLEYKPLVFPPSDMAALQIRQVSKEELANAFGIPLSLLKTEDVNRANAEAGHYQHALLSVRPKCIRLQERINKDLVPLFDPDERLFVAFDDPVPQNDVERRTQRKEDLQLGVRTINEIREEDGLPPQPWGNVPILPLAMAPLDSELRKPKPAPAPGGPPRPAPGGKVAAAVRLSLTEIQSLCEEHGI